MIDSDLIPQIHRRAYEIWESEGRPHGRDKIHWLVAEAELSNSDRRTTAEPSKPKRKARSVSASAPTATRRSR